AQRTSDGGGLLHALGILLGVAVDLVDRLIQSTDIVALGAARGADLFHDAGDALDRAQNLLHRRASAFDQLRAPRDIVERRADELLDFVGGSSRALREIAHLAGYHRKAATLLAGARGLDGRIQRQQVGLECDLIDHADDVADPTRRAGDGLHGRDHFTHDLVAARRGAVRLGGQPLAVHRIVEISLHALFHVAGTVARRANRR